MQKRLTFLPALFLLGSCAVMPVAADQKPPGFVFGGNRLYVGMSKPEAVAALSACCKLYPPADSEVERRPAPIGLMLGHMILTKDESSQRVLGQVYFSGERVVRITRPLAEEVDTWNGDVVGFARALYRSLAPEAGDSQMTVRMSVRHDRMSNAESDTVSLSFPNGRGIELCVGTLDKPDPSANRRDFATLNETLAPARPQ